MSVNATVGERLEQMARLLEVLGEDKFRVIAHQRAGRAISKHAQDVRGLDRSALLAIEGVGPKMADKVVEWVATGRIAEHEELLARVPPGLLKVMEVPGLGPKTTAVLWKERGVEDLEGLERIIADGSILSIPRMGKKTVENLRASIVFMKQAGARLPLGVALPLAELVASLVGKTPGVARAGYAGSLRRGKETVGDIDILAATTDAPAAHAAFVALKGVEQVLSTGETRSSVRMRANVDHGRWGDDPAGAPLVQVDLRTVAPGQWGAALAYFTGSKEHNVRLRERSLKMGFTLNEYGLFPLDEHRRAPHERGVKPVAGETEEGIHAALGLPWIPPELREDRGELALERTPRLVEVSDIRAELHAHTTESDGVLSMEALARAAMARGFHTIAVTDHSRSAVQANGLSVERLAAQRNAVNEMNRKLGGEIRVLAGSEVDIHADGRLDYDDEVLASLDIVVASPHIALTQDPAVATKRLVKAARHPAVRVLGHPTGRLLGRRAGLSPAMEEIYAAARDHDVALEINAHWLRLDLRDEHVRAAVESGCLIAINCDVHAPDDFDNLRYGVATARRGWLTPERCVNTWSAARLHAWVRRDSGWRDVP